MLCQYRTLSPDLSAACSCVMSAPILMAATFLPNRLRREQGSGFFDGIPQIVAETEMAKHEALPRFFQWCKSGAVYHSCPDTSRSQHSHGQEKSNR
jgi:hypothetical protein